MQDSKCAVGNRSSASPLGAGRQFAESGSHPLLHFQGISDVWEGRCDTQCRFTFRYEGDVCVFRNTGLHSIVEDEP